MRALIITLFLLIALPALALPGLMACFDPELPNVMFECGPGDDCPDGYECRSDGCCHKEGSPADEHGYCAEPDAAVTQDASP